MNERMYRYMDVCYLQIKQKAPPEKVFGLGITSCVLEVGCL